MINEAGLNLIKRFEGFQPRAYVCPAGVMTIGYGTTIIDGKPVKAGMTCDQAQATKWLADDVATFEAVVCHSVTQPLTDNMIAALTAFTYNVGAGAFRSSTLLKMLNAGHYDEVVPQLRKWVKGGGKVLPGLVTRREAEGQLFNTP